MLSSVCLLLFKVALAAASPSLHLTNDDELELYERDYTANRRAIGEKYFAAVKVERSQDSSKLLSWYLCGFDDKFSKIRFDAIEERHSLDGVRSRAYTLLKEDSRVRTFGSGGIDRDLEKIDEEDTFFSFNVFDPLDLPFRGYGCFRTASLKTIGRIGRSETDLRKRNLAKFERTPKTDFFRFEDRRDKSILTEIAFDRKSKAPISLVTYVQGKDGKKQVYQESKTEWFMQKSGTTSVWLPKSTELRQFLSSTTREYLIEYSWAEIDGESCFEIATGDQQQIAVSAAELKERILDRSVSVSERLESKSTD